MHSESEARKKKKKKSFGFAIGIGIGGLGFEIWERGKVKFGSGESEIGKAVVSRFWVKTCDITQKPATVP
jgi:hypothetical protein